MAASVNDLFRKASSGGRPVVATLAAEKTNGSDTAVLNVATDWNTTTGVDVVMYRTDTSGNVVAGTQTDWVATLAGTTLSNMVLKAGTEPSSGYPAGSQSVVIASPTAAWADDLVGGILEGHNQDGTHKAFTESNIVPTAAVQDSAITTAKAANGFVVQVASTNYQTQASGTTTMLADNTIPQNTEGVEFMTQTITPKSATNKLVIEVMLYCTYSGGLADISMALFQDSTANALAANSVVQGGTTYKNQIKLRHVTTAGTTSATTFKVRAGASAAGTLYMNGNGSGTAMFGGVASSNITITEYKA